MLVDGGLTSSLANAGVSAGQAEDEGYDGIWSAETSHDPFLPLLIAAEHTERLQLGTGIAVAFARSPMTVAQTANDLQLASEGRFLLGLGSQIQAHITRRFSMPWSRPAARMREYIQALHAIWACWNDGTKLAFEGEFYRHTLMTPFFNPGPNPHGPPKVFVAAVGERMTEVVGEVADGMLVHGFTTEDYLRQVTLPAVERGLDRSGRSRADLQLSLPAFVVTGVDEESTALAEAAVRSQIAFYASTPAYRPVLALHGWEDLGTELTQLSKQGEWKQMGELIDGDMLRTFAVVAGPDDVASGLLARYGDLVDRISFYAPYQTHDELWSSVAAQLHAG